MSATNENTPVVSDTSPELTAPIFSAARIAEILTKPGDPVLTPTTEQSTVIQHPLGGSTLVVAGAGSGKTETMANRVVWLVANGLIAPEQVLGLTFTRKAAGELRERISGRLMMFGERLTEMEELGQLTPAEAERAVQLRELLEDGLDIPDVSTYNSFAAGVLQEFGVAAGVAPGATVIDAATAWRLAREVVIASRDPELAASGLSMSKLIQHVMNLDHLTSDNLTSLDRVDQVATEFARVLELPYSEKELNGASSGKTYKDLRDAVENLGHTKLISRLSRTYAEEKQRRGLIEFSDQLAFATIALERSADAVTTLRRRHRVVLLDEVQDTSVGQTRFLAKIFAGSSVMAVGDPHQSIYGWRGASAAGLASFHLDFRGRGADVAATAPATLTLSTSWRNPVTVLDVANEIAAPLSEDSPIDVPKLSPRPGSEDGTVEWAYPETLHDEHHAVAEWMRASRDEWVASQWAKWLAKEKKDGDKEPTPEQLLPTAAIVMRNRRHMPGFAAALADAGVPYRIVGLGGLLATPEITDIVSTLRCLWYADAGSDLIRLLAGPRFSIGVADLAGLSRVARWYAQRDIGLKQLSDADRENDSVLPDPDREFTLIDALDQIANMRDLDHSALKGITPVGRERLREAGRMLADLRFGVGNNLGELIGATVQALRLDIELDANEARPHAGTSAAHANIDVFVDLVEGFLAIDAQGTLASLLEWIERAQDADETAEHVAAPVPGTVQLITGHGSKGLEWDLVAVPRMANGEFPSASRQGAGWLAVGQIPDELRGDAASRAELNWRIAQTQKELVTRLKEYKEELKQRHLEEERRLAYVAVTRSASKLLLTGSFWGGQTKPRRPSDFLLELSEAVLPNDVLPNVEISGAGLLTGANELVLARTTSHGAGDAVDDDADGAVDDDADEQQGHATAGLPLASLHEEDPSLSTEATLAWPLDPLGHRAPAVREAARLVNEQITELEKLIEQETERVAHQKPANQPRATEDLISGVGDTLRLLLAERRAASVAAERAEQDTTAELPDRLTASTFHEFIEDPVEAERRRLRPLPQRPFRRTRIGNQFHEWVERRATTAQGSALPLLGIDPEEWDADIEEFAGVHDSAVLAESTGGAGAADYSEVDAEALQPLVEEFERSRWANLRPIAVEQEVTLPFAGRSLVCKLDAVYRGEDGRIEIVDWKAGRSPKTDAERRTRFFQLDLYRHAYAQWAGVDPDLIDVSLFYVAEGVELRGEDHKSLEDLEQIWREAAASL